MSIYKGTQLISGVATPIEPTRNIGQIITSLLPLTDAGLHLLDGAIIDGNGIYKAFVDYIKTLDLTASYFTSETDWQASVTQYGVCGKFVYDASANTVRLPKVTGHVEGTLNPNALGDLVEAGLPNIEGSLSQSHTTYNGATNIAGAFYTINATAQNMGTGGSGTTHRTTGFKASLSNPIYGNSKTVQTQSILGYMYIVLATGTKTDIEVDIDNVITDLNTLIPNNSAIIAGYAMPSDTYIDLTLGASGTTYTAPANGYFRLSGTSTASNQYMNLTSHYVAQQVLSSGNNQTWYITIPVKRGNPCVYYGNMGGSKSIKFVYAEGEV